MNVLRSVKCLAAAAGMLIAGSAMAVTTYTVSLVTSADCTSNGHALVTVKLNVSGGPSTVAGAQIFLNYSAPLSATNASVSAGPGLQTLLLTASDATHKATIGVGGFSPTQTINDGDTIGTIDFTYTGASCPAPSLVMFDGGHTPPSTLTNNAAVSLAFTPINLATVTLGDTTAPTITCPGPVTVSWADPKDPPATGFATAIDTCDPSPVVTFSDDRSGLTGCGNIGGRGTLVRTWTATDHCGNTSTCIQNITVVDTTLPIVSAPQNITVNADAGGCSAVVSYAIATAYDQQYFQGFENPQYASGDSGLQQSTDWNNGGQTTLTRVASGTGGIPSSSGGFYGDLHTASRPSNDAPFTRQGGYSGAFANGWISSVDVYINLDDPAIAENRYTLEVSSAASTNTTGFLRDFVFHIQNSTTQPGQVWIAGDNNAYFTRRNDFDSAYGANHAAITSSGWYTLRWTFRNNAGVLACDMQAVDAFNDVLFTETRSAPSDTIATTGGNRYMWFTYLDVTDLPIDNTSVRRPLPVTYVPPSGSSFPSGTTPVTCSATDACGNIGSSSFNVTVNSSNTVIATVEEAGLTGAVERCVTFDFWQGCGATATVNANIAFNSTNSIDFESYAVGALPGENTPGDTRTPGASSTWWLPSNCATSGEVRAGVGHTGAKGLVVGNNASGNDGVIDNLKSPRLPYLAGETVAPVNSTSSVFRSSYWFRTAAAAPADGFTFKSESYGPDRTTYFGAFYQTAFGDTNLNCGAYAIEQITGGDFEFVFHPIATNLAWGTWYRVECDITFVNGANNDTVDYRLFDSSNTQIGSALGLHDWEEGARQFGYDGGQIFGVDAIQFQTRGDYSAVGPHDVAYVDDITYSAAPTVLLDVPCGPPYSAVTVRDIKHTLRRTSAGPLNFHIASPNYVADFTSATGKALEQGNLNDDNYIDILDFGGFIGQLNSTPGGSTPCGYVGFNADFSGNGIVGTEDFTFIQFGFLHFRDLNPCGQPIVGDAPTTDISVTDLVANGLRSYAMADFNLDGRLNAGDIAYVAQHGLPRCTADFNDDQAVDVSDIFAFLTAWFADHPKADLNNNNHADVQDIFQFLNVWFQGC